MKVIQLCSLILAVIVCVDSDIVGVADFQYSLTSTNIIFYPNYVGLTLDLPQLMKIMNNSVFQNYILNS